ncbi:8327_t:CDS:2, partial [Funneliformis geosporum]
ELNELFQLTQYNRRRISVIPTSEAGYRHARNVFEDMNKEQYKSFHNWKVSLDPEKGKSEKKRKIINSRRSDKKE